MKKNDKQSIADELLSELVLMEDSETRTQVIFSSDPYVSVYEVVKRGGGFTKTSYEVSGKNKKIEVSNFSGLHTAIVEVL